MNAQEREQHALKLHRESEEFRAEAKQTLAECRATLEKTQRFNDQAMINQRSLVFALNSLLPNQIRFTVNFSLDEEEFTAKLEEDTAAAISKRELFDIVHAINVLAMANTDVLHVFTEFRAQYNMFEVQVYSLGNEARNALMMAEVDMTAANTLQGLLSIESKVTELIIEAREEAEAKAEVEA
ncbi:TPA: hypothetical protein NKQ43_002567 [Vibrio parahaemolyticus]|uniref:hypothetical protein n=1 Tax=Vibrio parahaemolyticus TaxID=670 RepID=UPI0007A0A8E6|nr:hypothetical protein [Vibrio parahaemolyticus]KYY56115.1 hypothetical protein AWQ14_20855 [Vibrio parahaemolyticus]OKY50115.1 hypothetical protein BUL36_11855 [Vibrio parahaemolyticus]HCE2582288.1 hypothetical protein [Vibrio parahaemolyticus]HCE2727972.1 hypothetical protein [Vibrio parahaemolyticus]HCE2810841.1 hypothetical protein [Vibrio parahaemolyticus]